MTRRGSPIVAAVLYLAAPAPAAPPIVTADLLRLKSVSVIEVSWDGSTAVLAVRSIGRVDTGDDRDAAGATDDRDDEAGPAGTLANLSHLYRLDLTDPNTRPRQMTHGDRFDHSPALSPDGRRIAFVRGRTDSGVAESQVWVMPIDGGEARPVTDLSDGAASPRWSPDGRTLLVSSAVPVDELPGHPPWPTERPGGSRPDSRVAARPRLEENADDLTPFVITRLEFQGETALREGLTFRQLFLVDPESDAPPRRLTDAYRDHDQARFVPDGRSVVYAARKSTRKPVGPAPIETEGAADHPDRVLERELRVITVADAADSTLLSLEGWSLGGPRPSADGAVVAFVGRESDEPSFRLRRLGVVSITPAGVSEPVWLTDEATFDASVHALEWMPTRSALLFTTARQGAFPLLTMGLGLLEPAVLVDAEDGLPIGVHAFGVGGGAIVYSVTAASNPCVLRVRDARGDRLVWDLNPWVEDRELSRPVPGTVRRPDGHDVQYWLMEPARLRPGETYPLALEIHGGPSAMWGPGEFTMWHEFQILCARGYGVVYANPRGSGGYGYAFRKANYRNWGEGPAGDVLAVVDEVIHRPWVDRDRLVVTGGSYGGYLTAWIVAHDHRFKAAVAQRGVYDLATFFGEGNAWRLVEWSMGGLPWEPAVRSILQRESPFHAVNRIRTPLLIMHGSQDLRTGVSQSEMMYRALKRLGRPVEYVRYPNAGHDLSRTGDPGQRMDRLNRIIEFFDRAVGTPDPTP